MRHHVQQVAHAVDELDSRHLEAIVVGPAGVPFSRSDTVPILRDDAHARRLLGEQDRAVGQRRHREGQTIEPLATVLDAERVLLAS
jgi:hypothetical protein